MAAHPRAWTISVFEQVKDAMRIYQSMLHSGVIVRPIANYDMPDWLRVSIGLETENEQFLSALHQASRV